MNKIKVLVTVKSNKVEALKDSQHYKATFNDANLYTVQFEAYVIGNSSIRYGNVDPNEEFLVQRISDEALIWCTYKQFSDFISDENGGSGEDADTLNGQSGSYYRDRANHTGTQLASTISDFQVQVSSNENVIVNTAARHTHSNKTILDTTTASYTIADQNKLGTIESGAQVNASWGNIQNQPAFVASGADAASARTSLGLGSAATQSSTSFATSAQGALAASAIQPDDLGNLGTKDTIAVPTDITATGTASATTYLRGDGSWNTPTNTTYSIIAEAEFNTGTSNTARTVSAVSLNRDIDAKINASNKVGSAQEESVGTLITNIISLTQAQYDGLSTKNASTYYIITA